MPQRPTQRRIAERAGVSVGAVSRALANDPLMAQNTRTRIKQIADEMGYAPDRAAQHLRTGQTKVLNLILPPHEEILGFGTTLIRGITTSLTGTGYSLTVTPDLGHPDPTEPIRHIIRNRLADGVILSRTQPLDPRVKLLLDEDFPFITHGRTDLVPAHAFVDFDNKEFAIQAVHALHNAGAKKLAIVLPPPELSFGSHLRDGFIGTAAALNLEADVLTGVTLDSSPESLQLRIWDCLSQPNPPDGFIMPGEVSGLAALASFADLNKTLGQDVHLISKQTTGLFNMIRPNSQSLYEDLAHAGQMLGRLLLGRIGGAKIENLQYIQPVTKGPV